MKPTTQDAHSKTVLAAEALVAKLRKRKWTDAEITQELIGLSEGVPPWRSELMALLASASGIPFGVLCDVIGVGPAVVMARRRKDKELEVAVSNYLGAYFEDEASLPVKSIAPGIILAGVEKHAHGWKPDEGRNLSDEDLQKIIRALIDSVRLRVKDEEIRKLIGEDIAATIKRTQG